MKYNCTVFTNTIPGTEETFGKCLLLLNNSSLLIIQSLRAESESYQQCNPPSNSTTKSTTLFSLCRIHMGIPNWARQMHASNNIWVHSITLKIKFIVLCRYYSLLNWVLYLIVIGTNQVHMHVNASSHLALETYMLKPGYCLKRSQPPNQEIEKVIHKCSLQQW